MLSRYSVMRLWNRCEFDECNNSIWKWSLKKIIKYNELFYLFMK